MEPSQQTQPTLLYEVRDHVATITLNRPEALNAFNDDLLGNWELALDRAQRDQDVRVVLVTGTGRAFCVGGDVRAMGEKRSEDSTPITRRNHLKETVHRVALAAAALDKPYIAAVNGPAVGAGMDMASMADIRIASNSARFAMSYVKVGIIPGDGGCYYLPRIVGMAKALDLIWSGRFMSADEALAAGYVSRVVPADDLMQETLALAREYAKGPSVAIQLAKSLAYRSADTTLEAGLHLAQLAMTIAQTTEDAREGPRAFVEKREARFAGR